MNSKIILIISPDAWNALPVSKHHYAIELAKNNAVYFIDKEYGDENILDNNVHLIRNYRRIRGINRMPSILAKRVMKLEVNSILNITGTPDVVWSFDTSRLYFLSLFNAKISLAHIVDYTEDFKLKELVQDAHLCFASSDSIIDKMKNYSSAVFKINHGYIGGIITDIKEKVSLTNRKKGVYIGNLSIQYIDWKAMYAIAKCRDDVDFVYIGSTTGNFVQEHQPYFDALTKLNNTLFIGILSPEEVQYELKNADFCLMMYRATEFPEQLQNPHKIMQYLGSGKPIFASYTHEYRDSDLLYMYKKTNTIEEQFNDFLSNAKGDFSDEARKKRIAFALDNTYQKQIERISRIIYENKLE
jgi:hypothetical protein